MNLFALIALTLIGSPQAFAGIECAQGSQSPYAFSLEETATDHVVRILEPTMGGDEFLVSQLGVPLSSQGRNALTIRFSKDSDSMIGGRSCIFPGSNQLLFHCNASGAEIVHTDLVNGATTLVDDSTFEVTSIIRNEQNGLTGATTDEVHFQVLILGNHNPWPAGARADFVFDVSVCKSK